MRKIKPNTIYRHFKGDLYLVLDIATHSETKEALVTNPNHFILKAVHPSPLSAYRGFFGCKHFSKANELLKQSGEEPIDWQIENI